MPWEELLDNLARLPPGSHGPWLRGAAGVAAVVALLLWLERWYFARSGRAGSWAVVRLVSLVAAPVALGLLFGPARAVSGMEALAVFYISLLTVTPAVWFGAHWLAGRWARPALATGERMALAGSGLLILAVLGAAVQMAQSALQHAAREVGARRILPADNPPLNHRVGPLRAFDLPGVGRVYAQSLTAPDRVKLRRVEHRQTSDWMGADTEHLTWCTHGHDLHMLWSEGERPPWLRIHWVAPHGVVVRSEWMPDMAAAAALAPEPFRADLRRDGLDPVVPIARTRMHLVLDRGDAEPYTQPLTSGKEAGEERDTDCVLPGFTVWPRRADWSLQQAVVRFAPPSHPSMLRAVLERPAQ